jgi:hypothetical protein
MSRRGEVPFVAIRVGRSNDPREVLGLAAELRIPKLHALGILAAWEEFILEVGDAMNGVIKGYSAAHIAAKLDWQGKPAKLVGALKNAGVLATHRGTFRHPTWNETPTGEYARRKASDRETWRKEAERRRRLEADRRLELAGITAPDVHQESGQTPAGRLPRLQAENGHKERKEDISGRPPQPPAQTRRELASRRWEWMKEHAQNPNNSEGCRRYLEQISEADWPLVAWVLEGCPGGASRSSSRKKRTLGRPAYQILRSEEWHQFRREWEEKLRQDAAPKNGHAHRAAPAARPAELVDKAGALAYVLEILAAPEVDEKKKARVRAQYESTHGPIPDAPLPAEPPAN